MAAYGFHELLSCFGLAPQSYVLEPYGTGHIHATYRVMAKQDQSENYILQRLNNSVFQQPESIMRNWQKALKALDSKGEGSLLVRFTKTVYGATMHLDKDGNHWRMMPFVEGTKVYESFDKVPTVFEAAFAFGRLEKLLEDCPHEGFEETIPQFFDLSFRLSAFEKAMKPASKKRLEAAAPLLLEFENLAWIENQYQTICRENQIPKRIVHGDCKPSNLLFDAICGKVKTIADPDTLMPGYFFYDLGDMVRSMACTSKEDEPDAGKVVFRKDFYDAVVSGYLKGTQEMLNTSEKALIPFAGAYMLYMQAIRFMTDYLQNDIYYPVAYETHNLVRARNQLLLLQQLSKARF